MALDRLNLKINRVEDVALLRGSSVIHFSAFACEVVLISGCDSETDGSKVVSVVAIRPKEQSNLQICDSTLFAVSFRVILNSNVGKTIDPSSLADLEECHAELLHFVGFPYQNAEKSAYVRRWRESESTNQFANSKDTLMQGFNDGNALYQDDNKVQSLFYCY